MRDNASKLAITAALFAAVLTATPGFAAIDRKGFDSVTLVISTGVGGIAFTGANRIDWVVEHSDDGATWLAVTTAHLVGPLGGVNSVTVAAGGIVESYVAAKAAASTNHYGYVGDKRFVRATPTFVGAHATGTTVATHAILGHPANLPA